MGTNYYLAGPGVPPSSDTDRGLHIGKKSAGWDFLFRSHPALGLTSVIEWREYAEKADRVIVSEYGDVEDMTAFFAMATRRPADEAPGQMRAHTATRLDAGRFHTDSRARGVPFLDAEFF